MEVVSNKDRSPLALLSVLEGRPVTSFPPWDVEGRL